VNTEIKVGENNFCKSESNFTHDGHIVVSINLLCAFIQKKNNCRCCGGNISLFENPSKWRGIVSNLVIKCCKCDHTSGTMTSNITRSRLYEINIRLVYDLRKTGKGRDAGKMLCAVLNIPQPPISFGIYNKTMGSAVADVSVSFLMQEAREAIEENEEDHPSHITACFDGPWQKQGTFL
jgi:hypothetical protein